MRSLTALVLTLVAPVAASAHPDPAGHAGVEVAHFATDPFHVAMGLAALGATALVVSVWRAHRRRAVATRRPR